MPAKYPIYSANIDLRQASSSQEGFNLLKQCGYSEELCFPNAFVA